MAASNVDLIISPFLEPPVRPNGLRQADFFQFETTIEWRLCNVVDYATKLALACPVSTT